MNGGLEKILKELSLPSHNIPSFAWRWIKKNHKKKLNQDSWFDSQDLNQALLTNLLGSWDIIPYSLLNRSQRFRGTCCLNSTLNMDATCHSKTLVPTYQATEHHILVWSVSMK
jgi:hypothetical protein